MRILYVGSSGGLENTKKFYLFPPRIINGLIRNGHQVQVFNDKDVARFSNIFKSSRFGKEKTNSLLLKNCYDYMPELIILSNCQFIKNETLANIRQICPHVKIVHLNVDPLSEIGNRSRIKERVNAVDGIFITTAGNALQDFSSPNTFAAFIPNPADLSIDTGRAFEKTEHSTDLFFAAREMKEDDHRQRLITTLLKKTTDLKVDVYGAGVNDKQIFGINYINALANSKMGLIINKTEDFYLYASDRMSQYMANGLLVFAHAKPKFTDIFQGNELVTYESADDLIEKIHYYHTHDQERSEIAAKGYKKVHDIFNSTFVAQYLVEMTFGNVANSYPWPTQKFMGKA